MNSKELSIVGGVAVASFVAGGLALYLVKRQKRSVSVGKSFFSDCQVVDKYVVEHSLREHPVLRALKEHTIESVPMAIMITDPVQVQLFGMLLKMLNAKKCVEVGSYTGYNVLNCALAMQDDGVVYALDINEEYLAHGRRFFAKAGVSHKIKECIGPASQTLQRLLNEGHGSTVDFIYVDADKVGYPAYYKLGLQLLRPGGIIALDNMFQCGRIWDDSDVTDLGQLKQLVANKEVTATVMADSSVDISLLKIGDGVMLCRKL